MNKIVLSLFVLAFLAGLVLGTGLNNSNASLNYSNYSVNKTNATNATNCTPGWKCYNNVTKGYQNSNCSWSNLTNCTYKCVNGECVNAMPPRTPIGERRGRALVPPEQDFWSQYWIPTATVSILVVALAGYWLFGRRM